MDDNQVTVLGAGNGGFAITVGLTAAGTDVRLFATPEHDSNLQEAIDNGGIEATGAIEEFVEPFLMTTDPEEAMAESALVVIPVPAYGHRDIAEYCLPHASDGQTIALLPGYGSSILYRNLLEQWELDTELIIGECSVVPYACRISGPGEVTIQGQANLFGAAYPADDNDRFFELMERHFEFTRLHNVLEANLKNPNPVIHPIPSILNAGSIDRRNAQISLYGEGMTDSVLRVMHALDAERRETVSRMGIEPIDLDGIYELLGTGPIYRQSMGTEADHFLDRFITEDVPYGLRLWLSAGEAFGVDMPLTRATIDFASALRDEDYMASGRTFEQLGLDAADVQRQFGDK